MKRWITYLLLIAIIGLAGYFGRDHLGVLEEVLDSGEFLTFEARYTPEQILQANRSRLLPTEQHSLLKPKVQYFPYLLLEVKFSHKDKKTEEAVSIWSLGKGEMVLNTETWETTHGFGDCLEAGATLQDYKIINTLANHGGALDREELLSILHVEPDILDGWIEEVRRKHLIVQYGNDYRLHFEKPKLGVLPKTDVKQRLVKKGYKHTDRRARNYSQHQVIHNASTAFGSHFAVRAEKELYLPVYTFSVKNPDGTIATTYWNAINGKQVNEAAY